MLKDAPLSLALLGVGLAAAGLLVDRPVGAGVLGLALLVALVVSSTDSAPASRDSKVAGMLALALVGMCVVITSSWVLMIDFVFALMLASHAAAGGKTLEEVARSSFVLFIRLKAGALLIVRPLLGPLRRVTEGRATFYVRGSLAAIVLMCVFGGLFLSADRAFLELAGDILVPHVDRSLVPVRLVIFMAVSLLGAGLITSRLYDLNGAREAFANVDYSTQTNRATRTEWMIPLVSLDALFAAFVTVQLAVLFGGRDHVLQTTGLTYAEYARQGFFQLVAVALLTLAVVVGAVRWSKVDSDSERNLLRFLLGLLCVLTLVVLASALKRLSLYEEVFGLTRLRISVHATILWLAGIFLMVIAAGVSWRTSWVPRAAMYFTGCGLLAFSLANPDAQIARQNIDRFGSSSDLDVAYLATLSQDAWPELAALPEDQFDCMSIDPGGAESLSPLSWNLSRQRALEAIDEHANVEGSCPASLSRSAPED
ncbi:MAG: DUF4173 domain-containing protein [Actinomycetota bacterium]|nr:DUF4173 domain-containing protein [Actinomycetota bacterium]